MDVFSTVLGRTHGRPQPELGPNETQALAELRSAIWRYGFLGLFTGLCAGRLAAPFMKRFVGPHSNVATPLATGALFSMIGSGMATQRHSHTVTYAMFKRQETVRAFQARELEKKREKQAAKEKKANKAKQDDDDIW